MANLITNNLPLLRWFINERDYWDFYINHDRLGKCDYTSSVLYDKCLAAYIDLCQSECVSGDSAALVSLSGYSWEDGFSEGTTLQNVGFTGVDNGLVRFTKDQISNQRFYELFTESTMELPADDLRLKLYAVSGNTQQYDYPLHTEECQAVLNGGFFQGFFRDPYCKYAVLPSSLEGGDVWNLEFTLKKEDLEPESNKTLNDKHPNNKGIFFYLGTRAENKWAYNEDDEECATLDVADYVEDAGITPDEYIIGNFANMGDLYYLDVTTGEVTLLEECSKSGSCADNSSKNKEKPVMPEWMRHGSCACPCKKCNKSDEEEEETESKYVDDCDALFDFVEDELDLSKQDFVTTDGVSLKGDSMKSFTTDNKFLMFDHTCNGFTVKNWVEDTTFQYFYKRSRFKGNLFLLMNHTCTGYTVQNIDTYIEENTEKYTSLYKDLYENAFALRITDDGEIGYRYLVHDCSGDTEGFYSILEGYSFPGIISEDEWTTINVKIVAAETTMKLYFYVNGMLKYVTTDLPKLNLHKLDDSNERQETVPYCISLGGGTQGLADTIQVNYMLTPNKIYPLEENFGGSFIGKIKSFKFYTCDIVYPQILQNYRYEATLYP